MAKIGTRTKWTALGVGLVTLAASTVAMGAGSGSVGSVLVPIAPERVIDTREPGAQFGTMGSGETETLALGAFVPADAEAIEVNVTVVGGTTNSHLRIWPNGEARPATSAINWPAGATVGNGLSMKLGTNRSIQIFNRAGSVDVVVDLMGYFVEESAGTPGPQGPQGLAGPKGDPGVSDIETVPVVQPVDVSVDPTFDITAPCPSGKTLLSGGFSADNVDELTGALSSRPVGTPTPTGWVVTGTSNIDQTITAYALCATVD